MADETELTMRSAVNQALAEAMAADDNVILLGEDVADPAGGIVVAAIGAEEDQSHQRGTEQHGESDAKRSRDQHVDVQRRIAFVDERHGNCGDDGGKQREEPENAPESPLHRRARAWNRIRDWHGFPLTARSGTIKAHEGRVSEARHDG